MKWKNDLKYDKNDARFLAKNKVFVLKDKNLSIYNGENATVDNEIKFHRKLYLKYLICGGMQIFKNLFGYTSKSVISPSYYKDENCEFLYIKSGAFIFQADNLSNLRKKNNKFINKKITLGYISDNGSVSLVRNIFFEPSNYFFLNELDKSFFRKITYLKILYKGIPVIICSHSYNYIGGLNKEMANFSLNELKYLLDKIENFSDKLLYLNSVELGELFKFNKLINNNYTFEYNEKLSFKILIKIFLKYNYSLFIDLRIIFLKIKYKVLKWLRKKY